MSFYPDITLHQIQPLLNTQKAFPAWNTDEIIAGNGGTNGVTADEWRKMSNLVLSSSIRLVPSQDRIQLFGDWLTLDFQKWIFEEFSLAMAIMIGTWDLEVICKKALPLGDVYRDWKKRVTRFYFF